VAITTFDLPSTRSPGCRATACPRITQTNRPTGIDFQTISTQLIRQMNKYHEMRQLLDNVPETQVVFMNEIGGFQNPTWVTEGCKVHSDSLING
jgi:hypothetical protein